MLVGGEPRGGEQHCLTERERVFNPIGSSLPYVPASQLLRCEFSDCFFRSHPRARRLRADFGAELVETSNVHRGVELAEQNTARQTIVSEDGEQGKLFKLRLVEV